MKRRLTPEEKALWRRVARTAAPLSPEKVAALNAAPEAKPRRSAGMTKPEGRSAGPAPLAPGAAAKAWPGHSGHPGPADRSGERALRRGRVQIDARADLHGMTQTEARAALGRFLHSAKARGLKTVLVITGKGVRPTARLRAAFEPEPGILRRRLPDWLAEPDLRAIVSGYAPAHIRHGGGGAFYVTLRSRI